MDHPSSLQAKVWRREGQGGGWPHSCQCFFRTIPGNHDFIYLHHNWQLFVSQAFQYLPPLSFSAPVLRQWWLDGRCLLHANTVDHDPSDVRMWASWRSVISFFAKCKSLFSPQTSALSPSNMILFLVRFSDRRLRAQAFPWSHGRVFGNPRSWPRGRPAQVTNVALY